MATRSKPRTTPWWTSSSKLLLAAVGGGSSPMASETGAQQQPNGKERPLGIPTIVDRVVQMAAVLVLEPIFEADLQPEQYAYRERRSALDSVHRAHRLLRSGYTEVVDADLSAYLNHAS
jgi:retron-type reverse transcriptase